LAGQAGQGGETIKIVTDAILAIGASLVVAGIVALGAAVVGLVGVGGILISVAAGLAALAALNWDKVKGVWEWAFPKGGPGFAPIPGHGGIGQGGAGSETEPKKQSYLGAIPGSKPQTIQIHSAINLDGRKVGESVTMHQVRQGAGPNEGSPYHDATWSTAPIDLALVGA
jgi:hypothetical protein